MLSASKTFQNSQKRSSEKVRRRTNSRSGRLKFVEICLNVGILLPLPLLAEGLGRSLAFPLLPAGTDGTSQAQRRSMVQCQICPQASPIHINIPAVSCVWVADPFLWNGQLNNPKTVSKFSSQTITMREQESMAFLIAKTGTIFVSRTFCPTGAFYS